MRYGFLLEKSKTGYSGYVPDLPGCIATGKTRQQLRERLQAAIELHLKSMIADGDPIPKPAAKLEYIEVKLAS